jgi:hypothetical protein
MVKKRGSHNDRDRDGEYNDNQMTKMVAAVSSEGNDEHRTRTEGAGDGYGTVQQGTQIRAQEMSLMSLGL